MSPFRLDPDRYGEFRAKFQITTAAWMPYMVYRGCQASGILSTTRYCQEAICEKLAKDLGLDLQELLDDLPTSRGMEHLNRARNPLSDDRHPRLDNKQVEIMLESLRKKKFFGMGSADEEVYE